MSDWIREDRLDLAVERILDAAGQAFVELGITATRMGDIARFAGCSRATLYRYFDNRDALRLAFVNREAFRVARAVSRSVATIDDPAERLTAAILESVDQVRRTPILATWFSPTDQGIASRLAAVSEAVDALALRLFDGSENVAAARWLVRVIVSLLTMPASSIAEERQLIERFVTPALQADLVDIAPRISAV